MAGLERLVATTLMECQSNEESQVDVAFIELAGSSAFDLLNDRSVVILREDYKGVIHWRGAIEKHVESDDELAKLMQKANSFRKTELTTKNDTSSRSHAICRICIRQMTAEVTGHLYLIDLAGSEAARDVAEHSVARQRETRQINMGLSALKDCIRGVANRQQAVETKPSISHLPIRRSSLTKVLKHVFDEETSRKKTTLIIACLNPSLADITQSKNTLRYAEMIRGDHVTSVKKNIWER